MEELTMNKDLSHESNATLLSSLLNIPAKNLACKNISDILTAPMSITGVGTKKASKIYVIKEVVRRIMEESPNDTPTIYGPEDVAKFFLPIMLHKTRNSLCLPYWTPKTR